MSKFTRSSIIVGGPTSTITPVKLPVSDVRPAPKKQVIEDDENDNLEYGEASFGEDTECDTETSNSGYSSEDAEESEDETPVVIPRGKKTGMTKLKGAKTTSSTKVTSPAAPTERRKRPTRNTPTPCIYDEYSFDDFIIEYERPDGELYVDDPETFDEHIANMKANLYRVIFFDINDRKFFTKQRDEHGIYTWEPILGHGVYPRIFEVHTVLVEVPETTTTKTVRGKIITETIPASTKAVPVIDFRYVKLRLSRSQIEAPYVYGCENPAKGLEVNVATAFPWKPVGKLNNRQRMQLNKFMKMLGIIFCDGWDSDADPAEVKFNTYYLAYLIIYRLVTGKRPERIAVLLGDQGAGKTMLVEWICHRLWGICMGKTSPLEHITGSNFNSGWIDSYFLAIEEAKSKESDLIADSNKLKDMCTSLTLNGATKNAPDKMKNKVLKFSMFILSNYAYPVYINDINDRRFFVLRACKQWNDQFYNDFADCLDGLAPLLYQWGLENEAAMIQEVRDVKIAPSTIYKEAIVANFTQRKLDKTVRFFDIPYMGHTGTECFSSDDCLETDKYIVIKVDRFFVNKYKVDPNELVSTLTNLALEGVIVRYKSIDKVNDGVRFQSRSGIEITKTTNNITLCTSSVTTATKSTTL